MERHGVVNLDLTLTNVLMCRGRARLSDFGIAVIVPTGLLEESEREWCLKYDSSFTTLIHPFALAPEVLAQYYAAVDAYQTDPSHPQYINLRQQGVRGSDVVGCMAFSGVECLCCVVGVVDWCHPVRCCH
jgi:hypothetical protein